MGKLTPQANDSSEIKYESYLFYDIEITINL